VKIIMKMMNIVCGPDLGYHGLIAYFCLFTIKLKQTSLVLLLLTTARARLSGTPVLKGHLKDINGVVSEILLVFFSKKQFSFYLLGVEVD